MGSNCDDANSYFYLQFPKLPAPPSHSDIVKWEISGKSLTDHPFYRTRDETATLVKEIRSKTPTKPLGALMAEAQHIGVKIIPMSRAQLVKFFEKKNILITYLEDTYFGKLGIDHAAEIINPTSDPTKSSPKRASKNNPLVPVGPFVLEFAPREKDRESLIKLMKAAVTILKYKHIFSLFTNIKVVFAREKGKAGSSHGAGIITIDPQRGFKLVNLKTVFHELWHDLENKHPHLIQTFEAKRSELRKEGTRHRFDLVVSEKDIIGKEAVNNYPDPKKDKVWDAYIIESVRSDVSFKGNNVSLRHWVKLGLWAEGKRCGSTEIGSDVFINGWWTIKGAEHIPWHVSSQWFVSNYSHTDAREFGAEMFARWAASKLDGEPKEFMDAVIAALLEKHI